MQYTDCSGEFIYAIGNERILPSTDHLVHSTMQKRRENQADRQNDCGSNVHSLPPLKAAKLCWWMGYRGAPPPLPTPHDAERVINYIGLRVAEAHLRQVDGSLGLRLRGA